MAISLESISRGKARKAPRIVLLGTEKVGKSTFAAGADAHVFLPMRGERGLDELDATKFPPVQSYQDLLEALGVLYRDPHDFKYVVLDSVSALEPIIWDHTCKVCGTDSVEKIGGGFGKWKNETLKFWRELTEGLDALRDERDMGCVLIGHVKTKEFNDPETDPYTQYQFDITDNASNLLYRWADAILFANFKKTIVQKADKGFSKTVNRGVGTGQRVVYTEKRPAHPGGNRFGLPFEMELNWPAFVGALDQSRQTKN